MSGIFKTIPYIIIIFLSLIIVGFIIEYYYDKNSNFNHLKKQGKCIDGIVYERKNYGKHTTYISCKYSVNKMTFSVRERVNKFENINRIRIEIGDTLKVFFEKRNPNNSVIDLESVLKN